MQCEKKFFTIGEVAKSVGVEQYVLRFWESKFCQISPIKRRGRRLYDSASVEAIKRIKYLLYDKGYTIKGVQRELKERDDGSRERSLQALLSSMMDLRDDLLRKFDGV